jgi:hypothetical protein
MVFHFFLVLGDNLNSKIIGKGSEIRTTLVQIGT